MPCVFRIGGHSLDVSRLLGEISLEPYRTWQIGSPYAPESPRSKIHADSGACFDASKAEMDAFDTQVKEGTAFLVENLADLSKVTSFPGLEYAILDFGINLRPTYIHSDFFPSSFLRAAANAGVSVELSHYPSGDES